MDKYFVTSADLKRIVMPKKWGSRASKPLATKSGPELMPTIMVDFDVRRCGPRLPQDLMVADLSHPITGTHASAPKREPWIYNPDQAAVAAAQWGSDAQPQPGERPWLKSWNYPTDAFEPWPEKTDLCCWWCTHPFDWAPFPMPATKDRLTGNYRVLGAFCGPSCSKAYAGDGDRFANKYSIFAWIDEIAYKYYGYSTANGRTPIIPRAPRKELLQKYCGPKGLTIEQYRTLCAHGRSLILHRPRFVTEKQIVEAEDANARLMCSRKKFSIASAVPPYTKRSPLPPPTAAQQASGYHPENPDCILTTSELVSVARSVFAGKGTKPLSAFFSDTAGARK